jgi:hypothetical protein
MSLSEAQVACDLSALLTSALTVSLTSLIVILSPPRARISETKIAQVKQETEPKAESRSQESGEKKDRKNRKSVTAGRHRLFCLLDSDS